MVVRVLIEPLWNLLKADNRVMPPELAHVRCIITPGDVICSYACPALGFECDACPGRLVGELQILRLQLWMNECRNVDSLAENINSGVGSQNRYLCCLDSIRCDHSSRYN